MKLPFTFTLPKEITQERKAFLCEVYIAVFSKLQTEKTASITFTVHEPFIIYFYVRKGSIKKLDRNKGSPIHIKEEHYAALFLSSGELQIEVPKGKSKFFYFIFKDSLVRNFSIKLTPLQELEQHLTNNSVNNHKLPKQTIEHKIKLQIQKIEAYEENDIDHQIDILSSLRDLTHLYCQQIENHLPFQSPEEIVQEIKQNIIKGIKQGGKLPTLTELIFRYPISIKNFFLYFKEKNGLGPQAFINQETMNLAHDLLVREDMMVKEVSDFLGFENPSAFSNKFKKHFGYPPSQAAFKATDRKE